MQYTVYFIFSTFEHICQAFRRFFAADWAYICVKQKHGFTNSILCNHYKKLYSDLKLDLGEELKYINLVNPTTHQTERSLFCHETDFGDVYFYLKQDLQHLQIPGIWTCDGTFKGLKHDLKSYLI